MTDDLTTEMARTIWETSRKDEGTISATGANIIAAALTPLIEARVREARAEGAADGIEGLMHELSDADDAELAARRADQWRAQARATGADQ